MSISTNQALAHEHMPKTKLRDRLTREEWRRIFAMFGFIAFLHIAGVALMFWYVLRLFLGSRR